MGNYTVKATFTVTKQPSHEVSYGLFIGGENLDGDKQKYSYFLIRENGQFLIKKRNGSGHQQRRRRLGSEPGHHRDRRRHSEERAVNSGRQRTRELHGQREGSGKPPGNRDRHQWRRRPSHRSWVGCSDRWVRGNVSSPSSVHGPQSTVQIEAGPQTEDRGPWTKNHLAVRSS